jgi:hypothetical protein
MIFLDSRYADGTIFKAWDARKQEYHLTVFRQWPTYVQSFFIYESVQGDRLDNLATRYLGNPELWWQILDINPEVIDPFIIEPGTQLRIPNA